jgi:hypothetical protein
VDGANVRAGIRRQRCADTEAPNNTPVQRLHSSAQMR